MKTFEEVCEEQGYSGEDVKTWLRNMAENMSKALRALGEALRQAFGRFQAYLEEQSENVKKRQRHKLSFARPIIKHQVIERKPRHLIKKIIR